MINLSQVVPDVTAVVGVVAPGFVVDVEPAAVVEDAAVVELMESCRAVCIAAEEDFGLVAVEAQAAGKPVVAYGAGGSLETVEEGLSGVFFSERTEDSVIAAIAASEHLDASPQVIAARARRFSRAAFRARLDHVLEKALERRHSRPAASERGQA